MSELTKVEKDYYEFIGKYIKEHGGLGPGYPDFVEAFGVKEGTIEGTLQRLKKKRFVSWPKYKLRSIRLIR